MGRKKRKGRGLQIKRDPGKRVAVLTPAMDLVHMEYALSLLAMMQNTLGMQPENLESAQIWSTGSSMLTKSRQDLADKALAEGVTHMLWIDSDMKFPGDMLLRFLQTDYPLVGINAMARRPPYNNTARYEDRKPVVTNQDSSGFEKVGLVGFGVLWVAAEVFKAMERPFFEMVYLPELGNWRGEDYYFCNKAKALGYDIHIDHDLSKQVLHIGSFGFNPMLSETLGATP